MITDFFLPFRLKLLCFFLIGFCTQQLTSQEDNPSYNAISFGPQWAYLKREKKEVQQTGDLVGLKVRFDRLKRFSCYLGAEAAYDVGTLKGYSTAQMPLKSRFKTALIEGRFGYTFQQKEGYKCAFTPFLAGGYLVESNNFVHPSHLPIHFKTRYLYASLGFLTFGSLTKNLKSGFNCKVSFPLEPKCKVSNDINRDSISQKIGERLSYRVELPITYELDVYRYKPSFILNPFYEVRNYGGRINMFDFSKTCLTFCGITLYVQLKR